MNEAQQCSRSDDLIAWLYDEATGDDAESFEQHLRGCSQCTAEAAALRGVRHSVQAWRDDSLGALVNSAPPLRAAAPQRSALAALRQFFDLSPLWMKGAVGLASVLFCLFAVLAIGRMRQTPAVAIQSSPSYSEQEIAAMIERRAQERLRQLQTNANQNSVIGTVATNPQIQKQSTVQRRTTVAKAPGRRPLSRAEREQLAADLRLVAEPDDLELELIGDRIARPD
jgi:hypothetical protein